MRLPARFWLLLLLLADASAGLARAGGGGGGGGHGGGGGGHSFGGGHGYSSYGSGAWSSGSHGDGSVFTVLVVLLLMALFVWATFRQASSAGPAGTTERQAAKEYAAEQLLARLASHDARWNPEQLRARVTEVYFRVQQAWTANDQDLARDCMSTRLYHKHKAQTDRFLAQGRRNVLASIALHEIAFYSVSDFKRDELDTFWVHLRGAMVDYQVDRSGRVLAGDPTAAESFTEAWKFKWVGGHWILDKISSASPSILASGVAYSHKLRRAGRLPRPAR